MLMSSQMTGTANRTYATTLHGEQAACTQGCWPHERITRAETQRKGLLHQHSKAHSDSPVVILHYTSNGYTKQNCWLKGTHAVILLFGFTVVVTIPPLHKWRRNFLPASQIHINLCWNRDWSLTATAVWITETEQFPLCYFIPCMHVHVHVHQYEVPQNQAWGAIAYRLPVRSVLLTAN